MGVILSILLAVIIGTIWADGIIKSEPKAIRLETEKEEDKNVGEQQKRQA